MVESKNVVQSDRKTWVQPELKRIAAGSAETGNDITEDGGAPGNLRS